MEVLPVANASDDEGVPRSRRESEWFPGRCLGEEAKLWSPKALLWRMGGGEAQGCSSFQVTNTSFFYHTVKVYSYRLA